MSFPSIRPSTSKGKVKCFRCRELVAAKEGKWASEDSRQVFVCGKCEQTARRLAMTPATRKHRSYGAAE
jgi:hypothetical protein